MDLIDDATGQTRPLPEPERRLKRVSISDIGFAHLLFSVQRKDCLIPSYSFDGIPPDYKVERAFHDLMTGSLCYILSHPTFAPVPHGETIPEIPCHIRMHRVAVMDETFRSPGTVHATSPVRPRVTIETLPADPKADPDAVLAPLGSAPATLAPPTEEGKVNWREFF